MKNTLLISVTFKNGELINFEQEKVDIANGFLVMYTGSLSSITTDTAVMAVNLDEIRFYKIKKKGEDNG